MSQPSSNGDDEIGWPAQREAVRDISTSLNAALADMFTLYVKTQNFHWHVGGPHFRDYHALFGEQADEIFTAIDATAERVRKIGATTIRSVAHIAKLARLRGNEAEHVTATAMLAELRRDNVRLAEHLREAHLICADYEDVASTSLLERLIDRAEGRSWFLQEAARSGEGAP